MLPQIMMPMERTMVTRAFRFIFFWIDYVLYNFISILMQAIFDISDFTLSQDIFDKVISKIYLIITIFMLFKIVVSLITYLINPDTMNDKERGLGKMITRIIISLVMLIFLPIGFNVINDAQKPILRTLPRVILGTSTYGNDNNRNSIADDMGQNGKDISWSIFSAFFYLNEDCDNQTNDYSSNALSGASDPLKNAAQVFNDKCAVFQGDTYKYEYTPIISTLSGGFMCFTLIGIAFNVAVRLFKLLILRMIAPIPIISYIDPKSSKDGAFNHWIKTLISTWLELFINLGIMYLIVFLVSDILLGGAGELFSTAKELGNGDFSRGAFFTVFIILGLFSFANKAPKFLLDALGIKSKGLFEKVLGLSATALRAPGTIGSSVKNRWYQDTVSGQTGWRRIPGMLRYGAAALGGLGAVGTAGGAVLGADKDNSKAAMEVLNRHKSAQLDRIKRIGDVDKQFEDFLNDRAGKKGADIVVKNDGLNTTINDWKQARQLAMTNGIDKFTITDRVTGATRKFETYSAIADNFEGDLTAAAGAEWATGKAVDINGKTVKLSPDEQATIRDHRRNVRQTGQTGAGFGPGGILFSKDNNLKTYKGRRKTAERILFNEQSSSQNKK